VGKLRSSTIRLLWFGRVYMVNICTKDGLIQIKKSAQKCLKPKSI